MPRNHGVILPDSHLLHAPNAPERSLADFEGAVGRLLKVEKVAKGEQAMQDRLSRLGY